MIAKGKNKYYKGYNYKIVRVNKPHECEDCGRLIDKGQLAVRGDALDYSKSFEGRYYTAYWLPECYRPGLDIQEQQELDQRLKEA